MKHAEIHALLGKIAITFSDIEHSVWMLVNQLTSGDVHDLTNVILIRNTVLAQRIRFVRELTDAKQGELGVMKARIESAIDRVQSFRKKRNLFIHGLWKIDPFEKGADFILVIDSSFSYSEKKSEWKSGGGTQFTSATLTDLLISGSSGPFCCSACCSNRDSRRERRGVLII